MSRIRLTIASVLKPLKDPRAYHRFAKSLRETNKYSINIIGFSEKYIPDENELTFSTIFCHKRNHPSRLLAPIRFLGNLIRFRPKIVIVTTYELLFAAILGKILIRYKLIYDVQENYSHNIRHNQTQQGFVQKISQAYICFNERLAKFAIDHYIFAEACYTAELPKMKPFLVLENKSIFHFPHKSIDLSLKKKINFIISGTLTPVYGIEAGIAWFLRLEKSIPGSKLHLIGHVPLTDFREKLLHIAKANPSIQINISQHPIPYDEILEAYQHADCCIMPYQQLPSIAPKIPSKLYECLAMGIPVLFPHNPLWLSLAEKSNGGREVDFQEQENTFETFQNAISKPFFGNDSLNQDLLWAKDEPKLTNLLEAMQKEV